MNSTLKVIIGFNNYKMCNNYTVAGCTTIEFGHNLAGIVNDTETHIVSYGIASQTSAWTGMDIEPAYDTSQHTLDLIDRFTLYDTSFADFVDYGSAESGYWTDPNIYQAAYGRTYDFPLPQIYLNGNITNWLRVYANGGSYASQGTITDCPHIPTGSSTMDWAPSTAWNNWYNALVSHNYASNPMNHSTDIGGYSTACGNF